MQIEKFGFIKTSIDVHTLGLSTIISVLKECGYQTFLSPRDIEDAVIEIKKVNNIGRVVQWIKENKLTVISFSYRLDPKEGKEYFCNLYHQLKHHSMFEQDGGTIKQIAFAGLPDSCELVRQELGDDACLLFQGGETVIESLTKYGIDESKFPETLLSDNQYDQMRLDFAKSLIESERYKLINNRDHYGYNDCGTSKDTFVKRLNYCKQRQTLPLIRAHVGPYNPNREEALKEFRSWTKELAKLKLLDVLSIGTSQLTQSNFGEDWEGKPNGGGVPVNSELDYIQIAEDAKPMLVRTYAGTKDVPALAAMHEKTLNISWHALSFWWFCEIDGRGSNTVIDNLKEHLETIKYIAHTNKPLEPNVPHHFSFRGADDITYIITGFLAAKTAKKLGIKHLIVQNMLNTPKSTSGIHDLAKGRSMLKLVRELEDENFTVSLQARAGLDYFMPDLEKAKAQLAAVTALMDDIEPNNNSPELIHVVSYSEAVRLATPPIIKESIQITLSALEEYRGLKRTGKVPNIDNDQTLREKVEAMYTEAKEAIMFLEQKIPNLYSAEGLYSIFEQGYLPVPYMIDKDNKYQLATDHITEIRNGGIYVVDQDGKIVETKKRYADNFSRMN